jgi:ABC transport system ATP-binding/permease protein
MVTHDRYFLDRVCNHILELDEKQMWNYKGNYSYFLEKRDERINTFNSEVDRARNLLRRELEWMRRMPKARGTKAKARIESFYDLQDKASQKRYDKQMEINIKTERLGKKILEISYLNKKFGDIQIIRDFCYNFRRFEKIGVIGNNGTGKTTFLNIITGAIAPDSGVFEVGETVVFGYYKQAGLQFKEDQRVIDVVTEIAEVVSPGGGLKLTASQLLHHFMFSRDMQYTLVSKLSGGERRRLYLVTCLMHNPNFLILDEPTNDLDIMTLNVLEDYLKNFNGCVLVVSHDRYFMDKIADHMFVFEGNGIVKDYPGDYTDYRNARKKIRPVRKTARDEKNKPERIRPEKPKKLTFKEQLEYETLELEIGQLETEKTEIEEALNSGTLKSADLVEKSKRFSEILGLIDQKTERWVELGEKSA